MAVRRINAVDTGGFNRREMYVQCCLLAKALHGAFLRDPIRVRVVMMSESTDHDVSC